MPVFYRYIGIEYSGAKTLESSLKGIRVYDAGREFLPRAVDPPSGFRKY